MRFTIVIPSYLGHYKNAATNRQAKFLRAINSALDQTFTDFEVVIVGDGCAITGELMDKHYRGNSKLRYIPIPKQPLWSCKVRNVGIDAARGELITYLDTDDALGKNHLQIINDRMRHFDWVWYDDYMVTLQLYPKLNPCTLQYGRCGTSNITHKKALGVKWIDSTYRHDWQFIKDLLKHPNYIKRITTPEYFICHIPAVGKHPGLDV